MLPWVHANQEAFERDILQDFCRAAQALEEQFSRFAAAGTVSFSVLRSLIGLPWDKGRLWRLKDKAHHVFPSSSKDNPVGLLLDWTLGSIFHESLKLMEDAHQQQYYAPRLVSLGANGLPPKVAGLVAELLAIQSQTLESARREAERLKILLEHSRRLFCLYFAGYAGHRPLARFIHDSAALVRDVFQDQYDSLLSSIYGNAPERLHIEAALSLLESARTEAAAEALRAALVRNPQNAEALALLEAISEDASRHAAVPSGAAVQVERSELN